MPESILLVPELLAARRTGEALAELERPPGIEASVVEDAKETFARWEREAITSLEDLDRRVGHVGCDLRRHRAEALSRVAARDALQELTEVGLLPEGVAQLGQQSPRRRDRAVGEGIGYPCRRRATPRSAPY